MLDQAQRVAALRAELVRRDLAAFIVPKSDEFQLEHMPAASDRLAWLTDFEGSAGLAIVGRERAGLFTDDRYTEQARRQANDPLWEHGHLNGGPANWLGSWLQRGQSIAYAARVHTPRSLEWLRKLADARGANLVALDEHLVDAIWTTRPAAPRAPIESYPEKIAGASSAAKRTRMAAALQEEALDALVISDPASLAWLLNIRGGDIANTPFALGFGILGADASLRVFMDSAKWRPDVQACVAQGAPAATEFEELAAFEAALADYSGRSVRVDAQSASEWIGSKLGAQGARVSLGADPCTLAKACKTPEELAAIRTAHVRDGVALVRFLHWFARNTADPTRLAALSEWSLAQKLAEFREQAEGYRSLSFRTISAFGPNGASPHYTVNPQISLPLAADNLYLVDSGAQYLEGTTDITRVAAVGTPTDEMRTRYTQVLRGHIALGCARFPEGLTGSQLDPLARQYLWQSGVDFSHGTGHGVGCYLSVHEGPHGISKYATTAPLRVGMVVSNEPGYYKPGAFGIRIENLLAVIALDPQPAGAEARTLGFETLTLCPYDRRLIATEQLRDDERAWVDQYHAQVRELLTPKLSEADASWLSEVTLPLA